MINNIKIKNQDMPFTPNQISMLNKIMAKPISYVDNDAFADEKTCKALLNQHIRVAPGQTIEREDESLLFLQLNLLRYRMRKIQDRLAGGRPTIEQARELLDYNQRQLQVRSTIVSGNMGLVLSLAQKVDYQGVDFTDLVSEGSMALLRSVEKFDPALGFRFSTYACRAILKGFSRAAGQSYKYNRLFPGQSDEMLQNNPEQVEYNFNRDKEEIVDEVNNIMDKNLANLSDIEQAVVRLRFGIGSASESMTLKSVGESLNLTKERIRQIQNKALVKLKTLADARI